MVRRAPFPTGKLKSHFLLITCMILTDPRKANKRGPSGMLPIELHRDQPEGVGGILVSKYLTKLLFVEGTSLTNTRAEPSIFSLTRLICEHMNCGG